MHKRTVIIVSVVILIGLTTTFTVLEGPASSAIWNAASSTPNSQGEVVFYGTGYSIKVPAELIHTKPSNNKDAWHSSNYDEAIIVEWDQNVPGSHIRGLEEANLASGEVQAPAILAHPAVNGAPTPGSLLEKPISPAGSYGMYLYVTGSKANIYLVTGLSSSPQARASVEDSLRSFTLDPPQP